MVQNSRHTAPVTTQSACSRIQHSIAVASLATRRTPPPPLPTPPYPTPPPLTNLKMATKPRPDSALDVETQPRVPTATKPTPASRVSALTDAAPTTKPTTVARRAWPVELAVFLILLLVGLCLACIFGARGLAEVAAIDKAASALG